MKDLRKESLLVRDKVVKVLKDNFDIEFCIGFNDLYKRKDGFEVRRLKGYIKSCLNVIYDENNVVIEVKSNPIKMEVLNNYNEFLSKYDFGKEFEVNINYLDNDDEGWKFVIKIIYKEQTN